MDEKTHRPLSSRRERNWQRFTATGRVEDYLRYATEDMEFAEELIPDTGMREEETPPGND